MATYQTPLDSAGIFNMACSRKKCAPNSPHVTGSGSHSDWIVGRVNATANEISKMTQGQMGVKRKYFLKIGDANWVTGRLLTDLALLNL